MEVDSATTSEGTMSLVECLLLCVSYNNSTPALRVALRKHLSRAEDVVCVLEVLESWIIQGDSIVRWTGSDPPAVNGADDPPSTPPLSKALVLFFCHSIFF
jgi:hypothetical protein